MIYFSDTVDGGRKVLQRKSRNQIMTLIIPWAGLYFGTDDARSSGPLQNKSGKRRYISFVIPTSELRIDLVVFKVRMKTVSREEFISPFTTCPRPSVPFAGTILQIDDAYTLDQPDELDRDVVLLQEFLEASPPDSYIIITAGNLENSILL